MPDIEVTSGVDLTGIQRDLAKGTIMAQQGGANMAQAFNRGAAGVALQPTGRQFTAAQVSGLLGIPSRQQAARAVDDVSKETHRLNAELRRSMQMTFAGMNLSSVGMMMSAAITLPIVAAGAASIKFATDFSQSMANVNSLLKMSSNELEAYSARVRDMSANAQGIVQTSDDLAKALYGIASSGFSGQKGLNILQVAAMGATAGLTTAETSAHALLAVLNSFAPGTYTAEQAMNIMFRTVDLGILNFEQLSKSLGVVLPAAEAAGVKFEELSAAIVTTTRAGLNAEMSTIGLARLFTSLAAPTPKAATAIRELGLDLDETTIRAKGLGYVLSELRRGTGGSLAKLREVIPEERARRVVIPLMRREGTEYESALTKVNTANEGTGATFQALMKQQEGAMLQFQMMMKQLKELGSSLGKDALPTLIELAQGVSGLVQAFRQLPPGVQNTIKTAAVLAATMGPLIFVFGKFIAMVSGWQYSLAVFAKHSADLASSTTASGTAATASGTAISQFGNASTALAGQQTAAATAINATTAAMGRQTAAATIAATAQGTLASRGASSAGQAAVSKIAKESPYGGTPLFSGAAPMTPAQKAAAERTIDQLGARQRYQQQLTIDEQVRAQIRAQQTPYAMGAAKAEQARLSSIATRMPATTKAMGLEKATTDGNTFTGALGAISKALGVLSMAIMVFSIGAVVKGFVDAKRAADLNSMSLQELTDKYKKLEQAEGGFATERKRGSMGLLFSGVPAATTPTEAGQDEILKQLETTPAAIQYILDKAKQSGNEARASAEENFASIRRDAIEAMLNVDDVYTKSRLGAIVNRLDVEGSAALTETAWQQLTAFERQTMTAHFRELQAEVDRQKAIAVAPAVTVDEKAAKAAAQVLWNTTQKRLTTEMAMLGPMTFNQPVNVNIELEAFTTRRRSAAIESTKPFQTEIDLIEKQIKDAKDAAEYLQLTTPESGRQDRSELKAAQREMENVREQLTAYKDELKDAKVEQDKFLNPSLVGMQAMEDKLFQLGLVAKQYQLELLAIDEQFAARELAAQKEDLEAQLAVLKENHKEVQKETSRHNQVVAFDFMSAMHQERKTGVSIVRQMWEWQEQQKEKADKSQSNRSTGSQQTAAQERAAEASRRAQMLSIEKRLASFNLEAGAAAVGRQISREELVEALTFSEPLRALKLFKERTEEITFADAMTGLQRTTDQMDDLERNKIPATEEALKTWETEIDRINEALGGGGGKDTGVSAQVKAINLQIFEAEQRIKYWQDQMKIAMDQAEQDIAKATGLDDDSKWKRTLIYNELLSAGELIDRIDVIAAKTRKLFEPFGGEPGGFIGTFGAKLDKTQETMAAEKAMQTRIAILSRDLGTLSDSEVDLGSLDTETLFQMMRNVTEYSTGFPVPRKSMDPTTLKLYEERTRAALKLIEVTTKGVATDTNGNPITPTAPMSVPVPVAPYPVYSDGGTEGYLGQASGGRVPGALGESRIIVAHGGEVITPAGRSVTNNYNSQNWNVNQYGGRNAGNVDGLRREVRIRSLTGWW